MAERLVYKPHCGCEVYRIMNHKPNLYRIQYCATHLAAPQLYEALKIVVDSYERLGTSACMARMIKELPNFKQIIALVDK